MPELQQLTARHAAAVLRFEVENRAFFAEWVTDRGDDFFAEFDAVFDARLAEQDAGAGAYFVLVEGDGAVAGRVNLIFTSGASATLGYRMAEQSTGRGLATTAVGELCGLAVEMFELDRLVAATSLRNVASQRVLIKAGFVLTGPADPADVGGKAGYRYERDLRSK